MQKSLVSEEDLATSNASLLLSSCDLSFLKLLVFCCRDYEFVDGDGKNIAAGLDTFMGAVR